MGGEEGGKEDAIDFMDVESEDVVDLGYGEGWLVCRLVGFALLCWQCKVAPDY